MVGSKGNLMRVEAILAQRILMEFQDSIYPGDNSLVPEQRYERTEAGRIAEALRGAKWQELSISAIRSRYQGDSSAVLIWLTDSAFYYYYPAFLKITLSEFSSADLTAYSAANVFVNFPQTSESIVEKQIRRRSLFSVTQLQLISEVFIFAQTEFANDGWSLPAAIRTIQALMG